MDAVGIIASAQLAAQEGGGAPEWVPENAKIHIDFPNDRAWTEADGEVEINTLLGSDANTDNGFGPTAYDPDLLEATGYVMAGSGDAFAFIGAALTKLLSGSTVVLTWEFSGNTASLLLLDDSGVDAIEIVMSKEVEPDPSTLSASSYGGSYSRFEQDVLNTSGNNVFAATLTPTRAELAVNGNGPYDDDLTSADWPDETLVCALAYTDGTFKAITIYDALPDTTGLTGLTSP